MSARSCTVTLLALAAFGCGASDEAALGPPGRHPIPGCERFDPAPCDVLEAECQDRLLGIAACLRGSEPAEPPPITVLSEAEFDALLRESAAMEEPDPDLPHYEAAFTFLGLAAPGSFGEEADIQRAVENIGGWYDGDERSILIVKRDEATDLEVSNATLVHEFVHALQDRDVVLDDFQAEHGATLDSDMAARAIVEGEARFHEEHYLASMLGFDPATIEWSTLFQNGVELGEIRVLTAESPLFEGESSFKYLWGSRYIHWGWGETGHSGVLDLFANPPATTHEFMASVERVTPDDFEPSTLALPVPPPEWRLVSADRLGAMGVFERLGRLSSTQQGRALALAWRGDVLGIFAGSADFFDPSATLVTWTIEFADEASAQGAGALLLNWLGANFVRVDGVRVRIAVTDRLTSLGFALDPPPEP